MEGGLFTGIEQQEDQDSQPIENPFAENVSSTLVEHGPLNQSMTSSTSSLMMDKKFKAKRKRISFMRSLFIAWRTYARQVARDKRLFYKIKDFIIRRLQRKAYKSLKIHYIMQSLVKHYQTRHFKRLKNECFQAWILSNKLTKQQNQVLSRFVTTVEKIWSFNHIRSYAVKKKIKQRQNIVALKQWSRIVKFKVYRALQMNIMERQRKRENAFKLMIFEETRLKSWAFHIIRENVQVSRMDRRMKIKALRFFSKVYKRTAFRSLKIFVEYKNYNKQLVYLQQRFRMLKDEAILAECFHAIVEYKSILSKDCSQFEYVFSRVFQLKPCFEILKDYSEEQQIIEKHGLLKRCIRMLKLYALQRKEKYMWEQQIMKIGHNTKQRSLLKAFQMGIEIQKNQRRTLVTVLQKVQMKNGFERIKERGHFQKKIAELLQIIQNQSLKSAFTLLKISVKLQPLNDDLLLSIHKRLLFAKWKDLALEDKRITKMMYRAAKHRNRVIRAKALMILKRMVVPQTTIMNCRIIQLEQATFNILKQYRMKHRVRIFKNNKAKKHFRERMAAQVFLKWRTYSALKMNAKQKENQFLILAQKLKKDRVLRLCINAFKKFAYLKRVKAYLQSKTQHIIKQKYFHQMQESLIRLRTKSYKRQRAYAFYSEKLLYKCLQALYNEKFNSQLKRYKEQRAKQTCDFNLSRKALLALYQYKQRKVQERQALQVAYFEGTQTKLRQILIKMVKVGMYWAQIKGRFGQNGPKSRIYLGLKYGIRWRAKTLMKRYSRGHAIQGQGNKLKSMKELKGFQNTVTSLIKRKLLETKPLISPANSLIQNTNIPSLRQSMQTHSFQNKHTTPSNRSPSTQRITSIEADITTFKNKKLLLKELEEQQAGLTINQQNEGGATNAQMIRLLDTKIYQLRTELQKMQPRIRELLMEIGQLKSQAPSTVGNSIQGTPMASQNGGASMMMMNKY